MVASGVADPARFAGGGRSIRWARIEFPLHGTKACVGERGAEKQSERGAGGQSQATPIEAGTLARQLR